MAKKIEIVPYILKHAKSKSDAKLILSILSENDILGYGKLTKMKDEELLAIRGIGEKRLAVIREACKDAKENK